MCDVHVNLSLYYISMYLYMYICLSMCVTLYVLFYLRSFQFRPDCFGAFARALALCVCVCVCLCFFLSGCVDVVADVCSG